MKVSEMSVVLRKVDGTELDIVNAARVSFHKESSFELDIGRGTPKLSHKDAKLINYLAKHGHWTPFGHVNATFVFKAPLFVARQLGKHQVGLVWNEVSRRYVDEEPECYLPTALRYRPDSSIKQGSSSKVVPQVTEHGRKPYMELAEACQQAFSVYRNLLNDGVAPEQARMVLPQNMMTEWWWTGSLAAWARVFNLRLDPHTQKETQDVVQMAYDQLLPCFPNALKALVNG